ncbi:MAG: threonine synthase [Desulfatiglans sp.]|jgi:threonine synthase|nr:threonine synthase [Thermodesulfobacteriota bacterium]MEE4352373.1 threonine synthase [Desulfatiglans sp.]
MKFERFPSDIQPYLVPKPHGRMVYGCLGCGSEYDSSQLLYTCPACDSVLLLHNKNRQEVYSVGGKRWRDIFDYRRMLNHNALKGIFRYYEFIAPVIPLDHIVYLGEAHTPLVEANARLKERAGMNFYFKNDGLNPSASFKDRGMACALSYINHIAKKDGIDNLLAVCASTGDTSASAALYASYLDDFLKSAVLLPRGKVTPQQLSQPLGSGATVLEIPGVFDDCMKVVESLARDYHVALLNSKNSWRILGQESFAYEIAQDFDYEVGDKAVFVPIGNAGNITAVMSGFLKFHEAGIIDRLPKIIGVQSEHADPVYRYYLNDQGDDHDFVPVVVEPSVAQAAMIGNPVSMPRVIKLAREYNRSARGKKVFVVQVSEQEIMDSMIIANRNGHIACTQGGESFAGLQKARELGYVGPDEVGVLDSTAHILKFVVFQEKYFTDGFGPEFNVKPRQELKNAPLVVEPEGLSVYPSQGNPLPDKDMKIFVTKTASEIADILRLKKR